MSDPINRAQFLRGDLQGRRPAIRPPWAQPEALFVEHCTRCNECVMRCEQRIIRYGDAGFPRIDFQLGPCTFCGECVRACHHGALAFAADPAQPPWLLQVEVRADCLADKGVVCRSCGERCAENAIRFRLQTRGRASPMLDADACNGCGECVSACPIGAIEIRPLSVTRAA
ncbi:MAG: ferredoxin-type protein NapF [Chromatiales bacterium]